MQPVRVTGQVDGEGRLIATVPSSVAPGPVEVLVVSTQTEEDEAGQNWMAGIAKEWYDDLSDPRQDIYTEADGVPLDGTG